MTATQDQVPGQLDPSAAGASPLDIRELLARCMHDPALAHLLLNKFEEELHADAPVFEEHLAHGRLEPLAHKAHALKGAAGAMSAMPLRRLAGELEALARDQQTSELPRAVAALEAEMHRCLGALPHARKLVSARSS